MLINAGQQREREKESLYFMSFFFFFFFFFFGRHKWFKQYCYENKNNKIKIFQIKKTNKSTKKHQTNKKVPKEQESTKMSITFIGILVDVMVYQKVSKDQKSI